MITFQVYHCIYLINNIFSFLFSDENDVKTTSATEDGHSVGGNVYGKWFEKNKQVSSISNLLRPLHTHWTWYLVLQETYFRADLFSRTFHLHYFRAY